jgi:hypothetical protein
MPEVFAAFRKLPSLMVLSKNSKKKIIAGMNFFVYTWGW